MAGMVEVASGLGCTEVGRHGGWLGMGETRWLGFATWAHSFGLIAR